MSTLEDLGLQVDPEEAPVVDLSLLPRQRSLRVALPQPARSVVFQLPAVLDDIFEPMASEGDPQVYAQFQDDRALIIKPSNIPFSWRTNTGGFMRGWGDDAVAVSDMSYLLRALGEQEAPALGLALAKMLTTHDNERFRADIVWDGYCNAKADIWKDGSKQEGVKGCGANFRLEAFTTSSGKEFHAIPRTEAGLYRQSWECPGCGARINARAQLQNFQEYREEA